jgi:hypothetical protein
LRLLLLVCMGIVRRLQRLLVRHVDRRRRVRSDHSALMRMQWRCDSGVLCAAMSDGELRCGGCGRVSSA